MAGMLADPIVAILAPWMCGRDRAGLMNDDAVAFFRGRKLDLFRATEVRYLNLDMVRSLWECRIVAREDKALFGTAVATIGALSLPEHWMLVIQDEHGKEWILDLLAEGIRMQEYTHEIATATQRSSRRTAPSRWLASDVIMHWLQGTSRVWLPALRNCQHFVDEGLGIFRGDGYKAWCVERKALIDRLPSAAWKRHVSVFGLFDLPCPTHIDSSYKTSRHKELDRLIYREEARQHEEHQQRIANSEKQNKHSW